MGNRPIWEMAPSGPVWKVPAEKSLCENLAPALKNMVAMR